MTTRKSNSGRELSDFVVCTCGEQQYAAWDVIDAAVFRGELDDSWKKFLRDVAAEKRADELELDADETEVSAAAEAFRYEHDLITAEETEKWLAERALTFDDFSDYFTRQYYTRALGHDVLAAQIEYHSASPELRRLFMTDLVLSGEFERITTSFLWRLAARCIQPKPAAEAIAAEERRFFERNQIDRSHLRTWLKKLGRDSEWFREMLALEAAYRVHCDEVLVSQARERELKVARLPLTGVEIEVIELESRDAAQEALFCLREDGMSMEEVAAEARYPYRRVNFLLEDIPIEAQQRFLSTRAGDILGPTVRGDGFELCRVISKTEPQADDPSVTSRIDRRLLERHFAELTSRYVQRRIAGISSPGE
jgi:hypothetical protein